ncbi:MAG: RNA-binding protein YhbY, partial [Arenicella sp.]
ELLKIKMPGNQKAEKVALLAQITTKSNSEPVQLIGRVAVIYRASDNARITIPSI